MLLILGINTFAQFTLTSKLLQDDKITNEKFNIVVVNSTDNTTETFQQRKVLKLDLKYDKEYTIIVSKQGYRTKAISVDTYCNLNQPIKYICTINLFKTDTFSEATLVGGIYFNEHKNEFDYYLKQ